MTSQDLLDYLLRKPEAVEDYPFGPDAQVFKIHEKMFALVFSRKNNLCINLKCDPVEACELRDVFDCVIPGYHMNKKHWNTIILDASIPDGEVKRMIDNSYALVVRSLKKSVRVGLELRYGISI